MYAVIETGGKQYRVELGTELAVERLPGNPGDSVTFDRVLLVADGEAAHIGTPVVAKASVTAHVVRQDRGKKLVVFKYRPKARHRAKKGHRQELTVLRVADIQLDGRSAAQQAGTQAKHQAKAQREALAEAERKAAADQALAEKLAADVEQPETPDESAAGGRKRTTKAATAKAATAKAATAKAAAAAPEESAPEPKAAAKSASPTRSAGGSQEAKGAASSEKGAKSSTKRARASGKQETPAEKPKTTRSTRGSKNTKKDS
jgi:large subunit ribosomal protein L21